MRTSIAALLTFTFFACNHSVAAPGGESGPAATVAAASSGVIKVTANEKGYTPSSVTVTKGQATTLEFTRTTDTTCARDVVFPDLNIKKDLPLNTPVSVSVPSDETHTYTFQCGMAMFRGSVLVK